MFVEKQGKFPTPGSKADIAAFMTVFEELNASKVCYLFLCTETS